MQDRYEGYEYCMNHILEDKSSSFKQCNFVSTKTGQKCHKPAPKADRKEGYVLMSRREIVTLTTDHNNIFFILNSVWQKILKKKC